MEPISPKQAARTAELARREAARAKLTAEIFTPGRTVRSITDAERAQAKALGLSLPDCPRFPCANEMYIPGTGAGK